MRLGKYGKILHYDVTSLGVGNIKRFTVFEFKPIGGIIFNLFNTDDQDRFHDHAFNAVCFQLKGWYEEEWFYDNIVQTNIKNRRINQGIRYIPKHMFHKIKKSSKNAISVTIMGPWDNNWYEWFDKVDKTVKYGWGRKKDK